MDKQKPVKTLRPKKCRNCRSKFSPRTSLQVVCSPDCAKDYAKVLREKKELLEKRVGLEKLKSKREWIQEVQKVVNSYIRAKDEGKECISCGASWEPTFQAGHFMATSIRPNLRFDSRNIYGQCIRCNMHLHGNLLDFRRGIIEREGEDMVEWLEGHHEPANWSIDDLKSIRNEYKRKLKEIKK